HYHVAADHDGAANRDVIIAVGDGNVDVPADRRALDADVIAVVCRPRGGQRQVAADFDGVEARRTGAKVTVAADVIVTAAAAIVNDEVAADGRIEDAVLIEPRQVGNLDITADLGAGDQDRVVPTAFVEEQVAADEGAGDRHHVIAALE